MPELDEAAVAQYTQGRLVADDPETGRLLRAALAAARAYCGWHVTPVKTDDTVELDGPGGNTLMLPTLKLISLSEVRERVGAYGGSVNEVVYAPAQLETSRHGMVRKRPGLTPHGPWWTHELGAITVKMTHGYAEDEAANWQDAILSMVDRVSTMIGGGPFIGIGPFQYGATTSSSSVHSQFSDAERATFDLYRLEPTP
ncbi:head-to-tail adaptor [Mycobacterium phage prophiGD05-2]|uniref:hypothetical protein n=1 Tax=Mycobacteroides abscessus TaxID=36809 RepID=UPI000926A493|nr:hypothetical protein [Mycobacteroides abscessus]QST90112.1 head-to-tail adaptor [Mycobacterium phage prophiGD05-2]QSN50317.1 hypothetical protein I3U39_15725 [Mycobacteroides abscessus subsp. abscessus]QSN51824.1 hypothetical protein I3U39_24375 [Mycobacteroides abscessus subsp. abscessus]SII93260.1 Uncharacterised protein [Mycobacteroides abscessus subsp. abscessus]SIJ03257.1 Uncharacterised protein [Mycobacteroides abscessus subsp. abscessus]